MARKKVAARPTKACCSSANVAGMIVEAVSGCREKSGLTMAALQKALVAGGYDVAHNGPSVKQAVKSLVTNGTLLQSKGPGAVHFMLSVGPGHAAVTPSPKKAKKTTPRKAKKSPRKAHKSPRKAKAPKRKAAKGKARAHRKR